MTDLAKLDIAIDDAAEFLTLARRLRNKLWLYNLKPGESKYPIDEAAKVRASSLRVYRALIDLRRREGKRL